MSYWHSVFDRFLPGRDSDRLSAFIDGELPDDEREEMAARIALDPRVRHRLEDLRTVDQMVTSALLPPTMAEADHCADRVLATLPLTPGVATTPTGGAARRVPTAVLASVGLLITAGVAFVGLRRRGLV